MSDVEGKEAVAENAEDVSAAGSEKPDGNNEQMETILKEKAEQLKKKDEEISQLKDQILRSRADFDNFRKRCMKTEELNKKLAVKDFAVDIIKINDDLIRASEAAAQFREGETLEQAHKSYVDGVMIISKSIENALKCNGVSEIDSLGCPFNPFFHEAVEFDTSEDVECDTVTRVYQKGFIVDQMVIRTAKVKVTKPGKCQSGDNNSGQEGSEPCAE